MVQVLEHVQYNVVEDYIVQGSSICCCVLEHVRRAGCGGVTALVSAAACHTRSRYHDAFGIQPKVGHFCQKLTNMSNLGQPKIGLSLGEKNNPDCFYDPKIPHKCWDWLLN